MSFTRISNKPGRDSWRDDGPQSAHTRTKPYSVSAANVGDMQAVLTPGVSAYEWKAATPVVAYSIHLENRKP